MCPIGPIEKKICKLGHMTKTQKLSVYQKQFALNAILLFVGKFMAHMSCDTKENGHFASAQLLYMLFETYVLLSTGLLVLHS